MSQTNPTMDRTELNTAPTLNEVCARTFLYLTTLRQQVKGAHVSLNEALTALQQVWREEELEARAAADLFESYRKARYLLVVCADELIRRSEWSEASSWPSQESAQFGTTVGGERFFELMEDPSYRTPELREVFFQCLALGFQGQHVGDRAALRDMRRNLRLGLADVPRDRSEFITPEVYSETQGEDFTSMPVASTARLVVVLAGLVLVLGLFARLSYARSVRALSENAARILETTGR